MKHTIRENINPQYSLHDMNVTAFEITGNDIFMKTQSGMMKAAPPYNQPDGYVAFHEVQWDFSYVYLLDLAGNVGTFTGKKMYLKDFITDNPALNFSVMDETYGYNSTKYSGYITISGRFLECFIEIYHEGNMVFVTEEPSHI